MLGSNHSLEALVLAAGEGSRLKRHTEQKVLEPIARVPILGRILQGLKETGIEKVHIVIGYEGHKIREEFGEHYRGLDINYVKAQNWEKGNLYSFMAAKEIFQDKFLLCMGDHVFDPEIVKSLTGIDLEDVLILATDQNSYSLDDTRVLTKKGEISTLAKR